MGASRKIQEHLKGLSLLREDSVDLTPLIDCVFMLLIFFMVTTVFITTKGLNVDMPKAAAAETQPGKGYQPYRRRENGTMELNGEPVSIDDLGEGIKQLRERLKTENMILQAHPSTLHHTIVTIADIARGQGIVGIAFAREG